jgi:prevent-host-death family protein
MQSVKIHEAKTQLSKLIVAVEAGEEVTIMRGDVPVAKLVPFAKQEKKPRVPGRLRDVIKWDDRFFEPLPDDELRRRNGEGD